MRWVSYTRTTSCIEDDSPSDIIRRQNEIINDFMMANGWKVEKKYSDRKNDTEETAAFEQMVQDGMQRSFDGVVVGSVFRCGKNLLHAKRIVMDTFFPAGIHFAVAEDQFCSVGKSQEEVKEYFKKVNCKCVKKKKHAQISRQLEQGIIPMMMKQYGYYISKDRHSFEVDEEAAAVVRFIFQQFLDGKTYRAIARDLNEKGIDSPKKHIADNIGWQISERYSKWTGETVKRVLQSSVYATGKKTCKVDGLEAEFAVPVILSEEMFYTAQKKIEEVRKAYETKHLNQKPPTSKNLLSKRIYDKKTGLPLSRVKDPVADGEWGFIPYKARRRTLNKVNQLVPEKNIFDAIIQRLEEAGRQVQYIDFLFEKTEERKKHMEREISPYRVRAKKIAKEINQLCIARLKTFSDHDEQKISEDDFLNMEKAYQDGFLRYEDEFQKITDEVNVIKKTYSSVNPWLKYYRNVEIPSELDYFCIKKYIDNVMVEDKDHVEVILKEREWMDRLPQEWLKNGAEKL